MAERNTRRTTLLLSLFALLALAVAGGVDYALYLLQSHFNAVFTRPERYLFLAAFSAGALMVAVFLVAVAWLALRTPVYTRPAGSLLLLLGLAAAFSPLLLGLGLLRWVPLQVMYVAGDRLRLAGAFLAVLGLLLILQPGEGRSQTGILSAD